MDVGAKNPELSKKLFPESNKQPLVGEALFALRLKISKRGKLTDKYLKIMEGRGTPQARSLQSRCSPVFFSSCCRSKTSICETLKPKMT